MLCDDTKSTVKQIFTEYLEKKGHRKTPERYSILDEIYTYNSHFDVETLHHLMQDKHYKVSKATLYNTIDLLIDCNLITRHQFGRHLAQFERVHDCSQHDHLICNECGSVLEFCDPRIHDISATVVHMTGFEVKNHSLYFYGICSKCKLLAAKII